ALGVAGVGYRHFESLGGRRTARSKNSPNTAWRVAAFNAYADYMGTELFEITLNELEEYTLQRPTAVMCAEALPWRCHRRLIADQLTVRGWAVWDLMPGGKFERHLLPEFARWSAGRLTYPGTPLFTLINEGDHTNSPEGG